MLNLLISVVAFLVVIGILVPVHEFGHFWVARRCGVAVQRFSLGFGPVLLRRRGRDGVEYAVSAIPLGGYVKMLDEREDEVPADQRHRAFNRKPLWQRNAVIVAGPLFNFIFAVLVFWVFFLMGDTVLRPVIDDVRTESPAAEAGFEAGDEIVRVGDSDVDGWSAAIREMMARGAGNEALDVTVRRSGGAEEVRQLDVASIGIVGQQDNPMEALGFRPAPAAPAELARVTADSPASRAGLKAGDRVVAAGGRDIERWRELVRAIEDNRGDSMRLVIERDGSKRELTVDVPEAGRIGVAGEGPPGEALAEYRRQVTYGPIEALTEGSREAWNYGRLMVTVAGKMLTGQASVRNINGPVTIADYAGTSVSYGLQPFLNLLALISISLGLVNLLPIPVLDGGQLLFNGFEWVLGRPLSEEVQALGTQIGLALILMLMVVAVHNDLLRIMGAG